MLAAVVGCLCPTLMEAVEATATSSTAAATRLVTTNNPNTETVFIKWSLPDSFNSNIRKITRIRPKIGE